MLLREICFLYNCDDAVATINLPYHFYQYCQPINNSVGQYEDTKLILEEARTKWHSTGHVPDDRFRAFYPNRTSATANPGSSNNVVLCSEYASVDIQNLAGNDPARFNVVVNQQQLQQQQQQAQQQPLQQPPQQGKLRWFTYAPCGSYSVTNSAYIGQL